MAQHVDHHQTMSKRDRVTAAINHQPPDIVPWAIALTAPARAKVAAHYGDPQLLDAAYCDAWLGNHMRIVQPWEIGFHELDVEVGPSLWRDKLGIIWDTRGLYGEGEWGRPLDPPHSQPRLDAYRLPPPPGPEHFAHFPAFIEENRDCFLIGVVGSLFEPACGLRGMQNLLMDMALNPGFVHELLDALMDYTLVAIDQVVQHDVDACHFGDDWGSERAPLMGPHHWRRFIKPRMATLFARVKEAGKYVFLHSDGNLSLIFEDLIEIGLDVYNPLQPEIVDIYEVDRLYGDRLCFWGGIGLRDTLLASKPQSVRDSVRRLIDEMGANGGLILAQAHPDGILGDAPVENIAALIETVHGQ
jgi:uroporphyrinogen decarboxylase